MRPRLHIIGVVVLALCAGASFQGCARVGRSTGPTAGLKDANPLESPADFERRVSGYAHYATGLQYDLENEPEKALDELQLAALADPGHEPLVIEVARRLIRSQKADRAVEVLGKSATLPSATGDIFAWLGLAYSQAGKTNQAIDANRAAIRKSPGSLAPYQNLSQLYFQAGQTNEAVQVLDQAAKQKTSDPLFYINLSEFYLRFNRDASTNQTSAATKAKQALERAYDMKPEGLMALQKLADGFYSLGDLKKAEDIYLKLVDEYPESPALRAKLTDVYLRTGRREKASEQLEAIAKEDPTNPRTYLVLGTLAVEEKKYDAAAEFFNKILLLNPDFEQVYYELAGLKITLKQPKEALALLKRAEQKFKKGFVLEFYLGIVQSILKDYTEAIRHFTSAEVIARAGEPGRLSHTFYYQLAGAHERKGDLEEAERYLKKCLEMKPDYAEAMNYLGYMWTEHGKNLKEARDLIEKAVKLEPKNAAYLDSLAWVLFKLDQPREALGWMQKAIAESEEPDATLFEHLGDIHAALNEHEQARDAWKKSLGVEQNPEIKKKLEASVEKSRK